ncbi:MAG: aminoacyl-tRNA hydrolase [Patescibacteria group bacterium]
MPYIIAGLGNPGEEYENTRHNTGRIVLDAIREEFGDDFEYNKKLNAQVSTGKIGREKATFIAPDTFMNNSGKAIGPLVKVKMNKKLKMKTADELIVIYDDFNLPLGKIRISYNRSSGGHNGVESIIKAVQTEAFVRIRIGVAPEKANGTAKTPHGDEKIEKFILGPLKDDEMKELKKVSKKVVEAVEMLVRESREKAMSVFNGM